MPLNLSAIPIELTSSKGNQTKYKVDNKWYKEDYMGYEAAAEYLCSQILRYSNISQFVKYDIIMIEDSLQNRTGCVSDNFLQDNTEIITLEHICKAHTGKPLYKLLENKSLEQKIIDTVSLIETYTGLSNVGEYLTQMLEFDALVLNEDRHANNIIFLLQNGEYTFGPIFDNGAAFMSDISRDYPLNVPMKRCISNVKAKPFSTSFDKQIEMCQKLYGSQLKINNDIDINKEINEIEKIYNKQIATRMKLTFQVQLQKYPEFILYPEISKKTSKNQYNKTYDIDMER